jgi:hypothetical protein
MKHQHHIIPKYMGGSDSSDNLIGLSITQHAMFHYCNWRLWNKKEDEWAWKGLVKYLPKKEIISQLIAESNKRRPHSQLSKDVSSKLLKERWNDPEFKAKQVELLRKISHDARLLACTPDAIEKKKKSFQKIGHQQGEKNSMYGKMWITDGTKEGSYRIDKNQTIPDGFRKGRVLLNPPDKHCGDAAV